MGILNLGNNPCSLESKALIDQEISYEIEMNDTPRVLSIQSHVVSGYVGNKSATLPLQLLGFDVDVINSVQFSNHTGYKVTKGPILSDTDLDELIQGLAINGLDTYSHLLTGYIGSPQVLNRIASLVSDLKSKNPHLIYVCDPVMGDNGKLYVRSELLPIYKELVTIADIITPNQFEVELLTDKKVSTIEDAWDAIDILHQRGCKTVVISSTEFGNDDYLVAMASSHADGHRRALTINIPKLPTSFTGTGDLFAALILAWMHKTNNLKSALENSINTLQAVLKKTWDYAKAVGDSRHNMELKLVQSKNLIENPQRVVFAVDVNKS
ncbi:hypothetical protein PPYR_08285 [Photinus pyralis]|uniref:Pyridoxal kinase n=1 Tax=Photinus pyralis TaxID=7054 RepID=A0A1Y1KLW8_PHOPY|nr:pyridoxal kinase [Photinus pyralis]KAB0797291.1 hypothetical protein PPYR_08285 [Photinus pyralis]